MEIVNAIILGIVQGLTEWLPVSSTAHLRLVPVALGWSDPGAAFTAYLQLGTLLAVLIYFKSDLSKAFKGWVAGISDKAKRTTNEFKMGQAIFLGSIPIIVLGFIFKDKIEGNLRSLSVIAFGLIFMGLFMLVAERFGKQTKTLNDVTPTNGLIIGLWQALALIPGFSRSGSTMTGGLLQGFDRVTAAKFSFLLSVPSVFLAGIYSMYRHKSEIGGLIMPILVGNLFSFAVGYLTIGLFMKLIQTRGNLPFIIYRVCLGAFIFAMIWSGKLDPMAGISTKTTMKESNVSQEAR